MELTNFEIRTFGEIQYFLYNDTPGNRNHMINLDNNNVITSPGLLTLDNSNSKFIPNGPIIIHGTGCATQIHDDVKLKTFFIFSTIHIHAYEYGNADAKAKIDTTGYGQIKYYHDKSLFIMVNATSPGKIIVCDHNFKIKYDKSAVQFVGIHADWLIVRVSGIEEYINLITFKTYNEMPLYRFKSNELIITYDHNKKQQICVFRKLKFSTDECAICMDDIVSRVCLVPCGHTNVCPKCVIDIKLCPNCRCKIQQKINLFV